MARVVVPVEAIAADSTAGCRETGGNLPAWNERSAAQYRKLEQEQRALAADAPSAATRDIHLEFAERYRRLAEQLADEPNLDEGKPSGI